MEWNVHIHAGLAVIKEKRLVAPGFVTQGLFVGWDLHEALQGLHPLKGFHPLNLSALVQQCARPVSSRPGIKSTHDAQ